MLRFAALSLLAVPALGEYSDDDDVVILTDDNFEEEVIESSETVLVEFYAPWCGHCKNLEPEWKNAATQLKQEGSSAKLMAYDASSGGKYGQKYEVQGFPTIKMFPAGAKDEPPQAYEGARDASGIVAFVHENAPSAPPEIVEIVSQEQYDACKESSLCAVFFLPHILDEGAQGRNDRLAAIGKAAVGNHKFKFFWVQGGDQQHLEAAVGVGGFGYPAAVVINHDKSRFALMKQAPDAKGIKDFLGGIMSGATRTEPLPEAGVKKVYTNEPWDGKDGTPPDEPDYGEL